MPSAIASCGGFAPVAIGETDHMLLLAGGFIRRFPDPSMPSRTVLAAPSLARGLQLRPCPLESSGVGFSDLVQAPPLCFAFGERRLRGHDLPQMAQDRHANRGFFCVWRRPCANHIRTQKLR